MDPNLSVHGGRSDIPVESKSPIEASTVSLQYDSTEASAGNNFDFDSDPFFETELGGEDDDGWNDEDDNGNTEFPEIIVHLWRFFSKNPLGG